MVKKNKATTKRFMVTSSIKWLLNQYEFYFIFIMKINNNACLPHLEKIFWLCDSFVLQKINSPDE